MSDRPERLGGPKARAGGSSALDAVASSACRSGASGSRRSATSRSTACTARGTGTRPPTASRRARAARPPSTTTATRSARVRAGTPTWTRCATSACRASRRSRAASTRPGYRSPAVDDAHVRGLRVGRGHQRPLPPAARRGPDGPLDRLRHADAVRLRHRRPGGRGRVRHLRRRGQQPRRHGAPARRPAARPREHVDDDQRAGGADLGDVHRGRREAGRAARRPRGHDPERHPQGVRRPEGVPVPARAVDAARRRHHRVRLARAAALEHGLDQRLPHPRGGLDGGPGAGVHDRRRHGLRGGVHRPRPAGRRVRAAAVVLLQQPLATSSRRSPSSARRAGSGGSS